MLSQFVKFERRLTSFVTLYDVKTNRSGLDCTSANIDYFIARF